MDRLTALQVFAEVANLGSFTAAADRLDMSRAMVTRYVAEVEHWLGTRLLQRSTRKVTLTAAGEACLQQSRQLLALADDLQQGLGQRDTTPRGQLRVTCSISFGTAHLAAAVADYLRDYPEVSVDLLLIDRSVNLVEERVDLAVRITGELDPNLVARKIAPCRSVVCAAPAYLQDHPRPAVPQDLVRHNCLTYSNFGKGQWRFHRSEEEVEVPVAGNLSANEATALTQATLAGTGIALQPTYLAGPLIRSGQLVALLPEWEPPVLGIWGVYLSRRHVPATLRTFLDFLVKRYAGVPTWDQA